MTKENKFKILLRKILYIIPSRLEDPVSFLCARYGLPISLGPIRYLKLYKFLKESQWWPRWRSEQYQIEKLKQLLRYAYNNVPYYTEIFQKLNLTPEDIRSIKDLRKLPILTKEDIVKNFDKLISRKINKKYLKLVWTSGSTGKPIQFYRDKRYEFVDRAFEQILLDSMNIKISDKHIYLWSRPFIEQETKDIYLYEPHIRRLSLSSTPHSLNLWDEYIKLIKQFNPIFIQGNPSMLYNLACYAQEKNIDDIKFKCFISFFENLFPYQRELIEKQFKCQVVNYYISEERVIFAIECLKQEGMHINMASGVVEILGDNGEVLSEGHSGRVVATGLYNFAMPFIRYDIGDIGSISEKSCSCGRGLPLLKSLDGRANEVIKYKDKIVYSTTLSVILWQFRNIKECQFVQQSEDEIKVNIVKRKDYSEKDTQELIKTLQKTTDEKLSVSINFVDYIPRTTMGKFPFVISKINPQCT